jgi:ANTAR domain-containing protein
VVVSVVASQRRDELDVSAEVAKFAKNRAVIEQAKGMLMNVYGISADGAFELLKWRSQQTNVKLRPVAEQITRDFVALTRDHQTPTRTRTEYDNLLLTAHQRITDETPTDTPHGRID